MERIERTKHTQKSKKLQPWNRKIAAPCQPNPKIYGADETRLKMKKFLKRQ
jgi:hypothetical protein